MNQTSYELYHEYSKKAKISLEVYNAFVLNLQDPEKIDGAWASFNLCSTLRDLMFDLTQASNVKD